MPSRGNRVSKKCFKEVLEKTRNANFVYQCAMINDWQVDLPFTCSGVSAVPARIMSLK